MSSGQAGISENNPSVVSMSDAGPQVVSMTNTAAHVPSSPASSGLVFQSQQVAQSSSVQQQRNNNGMENSNGNGGSGNNSDNSALLSIGNNAFGFNFDSEEGNFNGAQNSEEEDKSDSCDGANKATQSAENPAQQPANQPSQATPGFTMPAPPTQNKDSTAPTNTTLATTSFVDTSQATSHDEAAAAAVANLQSIAMAFSPTSANNGKIIEHTVEKALYDLSTFVTEGAKQMQADGNDSGGYNSDDESTAMKGMGGAPEHTTSMSGGNLSSSQGSMDKSGDGPPKKRQKKMDDNKREERNAREKERSFRISKQINELRALLSSGGVIVPKGTKSSVLTEAANYIRMLQQHQYRSELDRHQLIQQMQMIGSGALGPQAAGAIRHVAAQNGVWSLGNFGGVPPKSAMTAFQQGITSSAAVTTTQVAPTKPAAAEAPISTSLEDHEYRSVFNSCSVGMAIASMGGSFIDCNVLFTQLSQYSKQEVCALTIFNLTSRQDLQHAFDLISQMISPPTVGRPNEAGSRQCVLRGSMKHRSDLGLSVTLIKSDDGAAKCFCVTLIKNPESPFDTSKPTAATADMIQPIPQQQPQQVLHQPSDKSPTGGMSAPAYTTG